MYAESYWKSWIVIMNRDERMYINIDMIERVLKYKIPKIVDWLLIEWKDDWYWVSIIGICRWDIIDEWWWEWNEMSTIFHEKFGDESSADRCIDKIMSAIRGI